MVAWMKHALGSIVGALGATGAIYTIVPARDQACALAALAIAAYLLGVKMPTPPARIGHRAGKP